MSQRRYDGVAVITVNKIVMNTFLLWIVSLASFSSFIIMNVVVCVVFAQQQQQNPLTMNGGSVLAMAGKNCVVVVVDKRFGSGRSLINVRNRPVIPLRQSKSIIAFTGMEGDVQSLYIELYAQIIDKYYRGLGFGDRSSKSFDDYNSNDNGSSPTTSFESEHISLSVTAVAMLTSHILYRRKRAPYYVEPIVVGLKPDGWEYSTDDDDATATATANDDNMDTDENKLKTTTTTTVGESVPDLYNDQKMPLVTADTTTLLTKQQHPPARIRRQRLQQLYRPYLCCMDMIGAKSVSETFVCAGTACKSLYGTAESLWEPNLSSQQLLSIGIQAFVSALERDCLSGYGATAYVVTPNDITEYDISGRSD